MINAAAPPVLQNFLSFPVNSDLAGFVPSCQLLEVIPVSLESIVPIAGTATAVMGVCNWRGEVLWLIDVGAMLKTPRLCDRNLLQPQYTVIIAKSEQGPVGLVVEQVGQMCWIDPRDIDPDPPPLINTTLSYVPGYWRHPDSANTTFALLDLDRLLQVL